jgi:hypothetical protein
MLIDYQGHPCAEDCGGPAGWEELKAVFKNKRSNARDAERQQLKAWYKNICANGERRGLDPWKWDINAVNITLAGIRACGA